jgi:glutathione S-transferase
MDTSEEPIQFVDLETARAARGVRLAVGGLLPTPWSEAAKALFRVKGIPALAVRFKRGDDELRAWTGARNVPVAIHDDEPPRTGWTEILALAERLGGRVPLVPADPSLRVKMHGLITELAGEGGLGWCGRLIMIHGSLTSGGARSFPLPVAEYLATRYGYASERAAPARARLLEVLALLDAQLAASRAAGGHYLLGDRLSALDLFLATFLTPVVGLPEEECPAMHPNLRPAFAHLRAEVAADVPAALVEHRAFVFRTHLPGPIAL